MSFDGIRRFLGCISEGVTYYELLRSKAKNFCLNTKRISPHRGKADKGLRR
jgi:hypothetical protein